MKMKEVLVNLTARLIKSQMKTRNQKHNQVILVFDVTNKVTGPLNVWKDMNQSGWPNKSVFYLASVVTSK